MNNTYVEKIQNLVVEESELAFYDSNAKSFQRQQVIDLLGKLGKIPVPIFIVGERGVGKSRLASKFIPKIRNIKNDKIFYILWNTDLTKINLKDQSLYIVDNIHLFSRNQQFIILDLIQRDYKFFSKFNFII